MVHFGRLLLRSEGAAAVEYNRQQSGKLPITSQPLFHQAWVTTFKGYPIVEQNSAKSSIECSRSTIAKIVFVMSLFRFRR